MFFKPKLYYHHNCFDRNIFPARQKRNFFLKQGSFYFTVFAEYGNFWHWNCFPFCLTITLKMLYLQMLFLCNIKMDYFKADK